MFSKTPNAYLIIGSLVAFIAYSGAVYTKGRMDGSSKAIAKCEKHKLNSFKQAVKVKEKQHEIIVNRPNTSELIDSLRDGKF